MTASSRGWTPLFLNAVPHSTGTKAPPMVPFLISLVRSSSEGSSPSKNFSMASSSSSTQASTNAILYSSAWSWRSAGMSRSSKLAPISSPVQTMAFILTRSTTPWKSSSAPMGICSGSGFAPRFSVIMETTLKKSAPMRSILFTKQSLGTPYLSACLHTVSDWGSTPDTESKRATLPSRTRRARSTSKVKSTCPGVSMILMRWSSQKQVVAAEVMVIPLSCSCSIQSIVAAPSWTSPILYDFPV
mmetsp:Transcript_7613/g.22780  ORF Transcript_7613/g.22780 Transcript_7613/m.22780 type:complete len:244 (-) Transcript_7613:216-947(-)